MRVFLALALPPLLLAFGAGAPGREPAASTAAPAITGILLTECTYGLESGQIRPLQSLMMRADGHLTVTTAPSADASTLETTSAEIGPARFRELAETFDRSTFFPAPSPAPSPTGLQGYSITTDTRRLVLGARRGDWWYFWRPWSHAVGVDHDDLIDAVDAVAGDKRLTWRPSAVQANAFNVCLTGKTIGPP